MSKLLILISQYSGPKYLNLIHKQTAGRILGALEVLPVYTITYIVEYTFNNYFILTKQLYW